MTRHDWSHEANIKQYGIITAAVIGGASALYAAHKQEEAADKAAREQERLRLEEEARLREIAVNTKPEEETATIEFGEDPTGEEKGTYQDFMFKPTSNALGKGSGSGISETATQTPIASVGF